MGYQPLSLDALQALPDQLYPFDKDKPQRNSFLALMKHLAIVKAPMLKPDEAVDLLMGTLVFEMEFIHKVECKWRSPNKDEDQSYFNWFFNAGSDMYTEIKKRIKGNLLKNDKRMSYLNKFFAFVSEYLSEDELKTLNIRGAKNHWKNKNQLMNEIVNTLNKVKSQEVNRINELKNATPLSEIIQFNIQKVSEDYDVLHKTRWWIFQNEKHEALKKFISVIDQTCKLEGERADDIRLGAALYVAMSIRNEYYLLSPEGSLLFNQGSQLYKDCIHKILNKESYQVIDRQVRIDWLRELATHISFMKSKHSAMLAEKCKAAGFTDIDIFHEELERELLNQETKKNTLGWTGTGINYGVQYGLGLIAAAYTADFTLPAIVGSATGPAGFVICLAGETIVLSQVGKSAVDYLCKWTLDKIGTRMTEQGKRTLDKMGTKMAEQTTSATHTYPIAKDGLQAFFSNPMLTEDDKEEIVEWIMTLLTLPDEKPYVVIDKKDKEQIRNALGIQKNSSVSEEDQVRAVVGITKIVDLKVDHYANCVM